MKHTRRVHSHPANEFIRCMDMTGASARRPVHLSSRAIDILSYIRRDIQSAKSELLPETGHSASGHSASGHSASGHSASIRLVELKRTGDYANIPENIRRYVDSHPPIYCRTFVAVIRGTRVDVHFYLFDARDKRKLDEWAAMAGEWLDVALRQPAKPGCSARNSVAVHFLMTPLEKYVPADRTELVAEKHVNTAFTYSCIPSNRIVIFRREDWFKTFIPFEKPSLALASRAA